jgi:hypothetical protein
MDKKEQKFYEAPACEVVELKIQGMLCASLKPGESTLPPVIDGDEEDEG